MEMQVRKDLLIKWLTQLQDAKVIQVLESLKALDEDQDGNEIFWDDFTEEQIRGLDDARLAMKNGERFTYEHVRANIRAKHGI